MRTAEHHFDFCVVGGGMAGTIAAITAARHGVKVALVQDRPVLGGNASSEIRMHICGAHGRGNRFPVQSTAWAAKHGTNAMKALRRWKQIRRPWA